MEVILISAKALLPLFIFMMMGVLFKRGDLISDDTTKQLNILVYKFFLSVMCAETIYKANLKEDMEVLPLLIVAVGIIIPFLLSWLIVPRFIKDRKQIPVVIQGIYKANYAILGIPIAQSIFGTDSLGVIPVIAVLLIQVG